MTMQQHRGPECRRPRVFALTTIAPGRYSVANHPGNREPSAAQDGRLANRRIDEEPPPLPLKALPFRALAKQVRIGGYGDPLRNRQVLANSERAMNLPGIEKPTKVPVDCLRLDRQNPRLTGRADHHSEEALIAELYRSAELDELLQSMSSNGYLDIEATGRH